MKKIIKTLSLVLLFVLAINLVACSSSYGKIEKALKKIDYTVIENNDTANKMEKESEVAVTPHVLYNADKLSTVIVFEFKATDDMIKFYKDSSTMQGIVKDVSKDANAKEFYKSLTEKGYANGNCLVMAISLHPLSALKNIQEVYDAVKKA